MLNKEHDYKIVIYFFGKHQYIDNHGQRVETGNKYQFSPYENKKLNTTFKFITSILESKRKVLGSDYKIEDQIPQKLQIFHRGECILNIPSQEGETITDFYKNPELLAKSLNEWQLFQMRFIRNNGNVKAVEKEVQQPQNAQETEETILLEHRRTVYKQINQYCFDKLGFWLIADNHLLEKVKYSLFINSNKEYISSCFPTFCEQINQIAQEKAKEKEVFEPLVFTQNQTAVAELTHTEWIESYIEILSNEYEKTDRKATKTVKKTFESAFSRCKDVSKLNAVFDNYLIEIKEGRF